MRRVWGALGATVEAEQDQLFLWLPVVFGGGIALYFGLPQEPPLAAIAVAAVLAAGMSRVWRSGLAAMLIGGGMAAFCLGLLAAKLAADLVAAPVLDHARRSAVVTGWVELVEPRAAGGERIVVRVAGMEGVPPERTPWRVRVRVPRSGAPLIPGDGVRLHASLLPPAGPALPGAYDFARAAWLMGLGAVGSARSPPERITIPEPMPRSLALWVPVERLRQSISRRITAALPGETGAIATALVTGERGGITEATNQTYRDSGIFHILSISGLHMTIFAGAVYFSVRLLLSLVPALALRFEIKKWAAATGMAGTLAYLMISGGSPPAVRSALMISVMFLAVLLDRPALALRNIALTALVILAVSPSSLIDVGFQMSFAAVVSLVSGVEAWRRWREGRGVPAGRRQPGVLSSIAGFLGTITLTTLIATASVAPFAAFYFHKSTQYGVLANIVAVPVCNLLVMPAALATLVAMPLGLEGWPLAVMGVGIEVMGWIAREVAALPGAVALVPAISAVSFSLMVAGGLWLCLWARRWRLLGLVPILAGLAIAPTRQAPDVLVGGGGALVGVRGPDGRLAVLDTGRSSFEIARWLEHDADGRVPSEALARRLADCDAVGCRAKVQGLVVAIARHPAALADDCERARLVVWLGRGQAHCGETSLARLVTRDDVARLGTHAIYVGRGRPAEATVLRIETVAGWRGRRPWSMVPDAGPADSD